MHDAEACFRLYAIASSPQHVRKASMSGAACVLLDRGHQGNHHSNLPSVAIEKEDGNCCLRKNAPWLTIGTSLDASCSLNGLRR